MADAINKPVFGKRRTLAWRDESTGEPRAPSSGQSMNLSQYPLTALDTYDVWCMDRGKEPVRLDGTMRQCVTLEGATELIENYGDRWDQIAVIQRLATGAAFDVTKLVAHRIAIRSAQAGCDSEAIMRLPIVSANFTNAELDELCAATERLT